MAAVVDHTFGAMEMDVDLGFVSFQPVGLPFFRAWMQSLCIRPDQCFAECGLVLPWTVFFSCTQCTCVSSNKENNHFLV